MLNLTHFRSGRMPVTRLACRFSAVVLCLLVAALHAADDPYLELLNEEATKVEARSTDKGSDGGESQADGQRPSASRERFEALLEDQHVGTFSFYRKLPERSRQEIFLDYRNGASMDALREKIVDRYLHP